MAYSQHLTQVHFNMAVKASQFLALPDKAGICVDFLNIVSPQGTEHTETVLLQYFFVGYFEGRAGQPKPNSCHCIGMIHKVTARFFVLVFVIWLKCTF